MCAIMVGGRFPYWESTIKTMYEFLRTVEYPWGNGVTAGVILVTPGAAKTGVTRGNYPGNPGNGVITPG